MPSLHRCRLLALAVFCLTASLALPARAAVDYTDIWFNPSESGWGVNFAQSENFIFATFFIYGSNGLPVWYTGELVRTGSGSFAGDVYATSGSWFGAPWDGAATPTKVGNATFVPEDDARGTFSYAIDTVNVTKALQRQTLVLPAVEGTYLGADVAEYTTCSGQPKFYENAQYQVLRVGNAQALRIDFLSVSTGALLCRMEGIATPFGKVLRIPVAVYTCSSGISTSAEVTGLRALDNGIEFHWRADVGQGCIERGRAAAVRQ